MKEGEGMGAWTHELRAAAESMYQDRCNVYRSTEELKPNGSTIMRFSLIQEGIRCRLSRVATSKKNDVTFNSPVMEIHKETRLYCAPEEMFWWVIALKFFEVGQRTGEERTWRAIPSLYDSHQEIALQRWDEA